MGEYGWYPPSPAGVVNVPERKALGTGASQHDGKKKTPWMFCKWYINVVSMLGQQEEELVVLCSAEG